VAGTHRFTPGSSLKRAPKLALLLSLGMFATGSVFGADPPFIISEPQPLDWFYLLSSGIPSFHVEAGGTAPLSYQWRKDGIDLPGKTASTLQLLGANYYSEGLYTVVITNIAGSITSAPARLTVTQIISDPSSTATFVGGDATFSVVTSGSASLSFQWLKDGVEVSGATSPTLAISNAQLSDAGSYQARVSNAGGAIVSFGATLTVLAVPSALTVVAWGNNSSGQISVPPGLSGVTRIGAGYSHSLALLVNGRIVGWGSDITGEAQVLSELIDVIEIDGGFSYGLALRRNGTVVAWGSGYYGVTTVPPGLSNVTAIAAGFYHALALKRDGTVVGWGGDGAAVPPGLTGVCAISADEYHSLALRSNGTVVAWGYNRYGQANVPAGLSNVIAIAAAPGCSLALKSDGTVVGWGDTTVPAGLSNVVAISGGSAPMALRADGTVVAWGGNTWGQATVPQGLSNVVAISAGWLHSLALVGAVEPIITLQPQSLSTHLGADVTFSLTAVGTPPLSYQWLKDDEAITGQTNSILTLSNIQPTDAGEYRLIVSNGRGSTTSDAAVLVSTSPEIVAQPQSVITNAAATVSFAVTANGQAPLAYQWFKDNTPLSGETESTLVLTNVQTADDGSYTVRVTHTGGSVFSEPATLTVFALANIHAQPRDSVTYRGGYTFFGVTATSTTPVSYQWQKDGVDIVGATAAVLILNNVQDDQAGNYRVLIHTGAGDVESTPALLSVVSLRPSGTVVSLGGPPVPDGLTNAVAVAGGVYHSMALNADGTVAAWGGREAQMFGVTNVPANLSNVIAIAANENTSFALKSDGTVISWDRHGARTIVGVSNIVAIASGRHDSLALQADGILVPLSGTTPPVGASNVVAISGGFFHSLALQANGRVISWGYSGPTVFQGLSDVVAVAAEFDYHIALRGNGMVSDWSLSGASLVPSGLSNVVAVSAGGFHRLALRRDGTVVGWGDINVPAGISNVVAIASGWFNHLLITANPPLPELAVATAGNALVISFPVAVPGYALELSDNPNAPFTPLNSTDYEHTNSSFLLPANGTQKFYRLRKN